jgi:replicative DNA helicase
VGLSLVVVDYLQLMGGQRRRGGQREQEVSSISRGLKGLARDLRIPVVAISQLNRAVENRQVKRPMLQDLRESGAIEQDADMVVFVHRAEMYEPHNPELRGVAELIVAKNRHGPVGDIELTWLPELTRFENRRRM